MLVEKIGNRGTIFTFEGKECPMGGGDSIFLVEGKDRVYLCDTHLGPKSMAPVQEYLKEQAVTDKKLVIFFSHFHWDHIWGACAFPGATVVAHTLCREHIAQRGPLQLRKNKQYANGAVELVLPRLTFDSRLIYNDDEVELIYTPGHTVDSAVFYDRQDRVLYVGDLVEKPRPMVMWHDLETYLETLELIDNLGAKVFVSAHSGIVSAADIAENSRFIRQYPTMPTEGEDNLLQKFYLLLMFEDAIQQAMGDDFDYTAFHREFWGSLDMDYLLPFTALLKAISYDDLKTALESYMVQL